VTHVSTRVLNFDISTFIWLNYHARRLPRPFVKYVSMSGDGSLYALIILGLFLLSPSVYDTFLLLSLLTFGLERCAYFALKNTIRRPRPFACYKPIQAFIVPSDQFSFPSGHTSAAFAFALTVLSIVPTLAPICYLWALLIGLSRVLLRVHYPCDIIAGAALGSTSAYLAQLIVN